MKLLFFFSLICFFLNACQSRLPQRPFLPVAYTLPEADKEKGKTLVYLDKATNERSYTDIFYIKKGDQKYVVQRQYHDLETSDSSVDSGERTVELFSTILGDGQMRRIEITLDTITDNGKNLGKYSMAGFIGNKFLQFNVSNSAEYLKDTLFTWQEKELPTLVLKQEYVYAIKWLQSDSSTLYKIRCTTYHAKGIGNVRTTVIDSVHNKLVNIDLIEIRDIER